MPRFRRKPTEITAEQWFPDKQIPGVFIEGVPNGGVFFYIITAHEQRVVLTDGDWIVPEPNRTDRYYPIKDSIFKELYEPVP